MCNKCGTNYSTNIYLRQEKANQLMWQSIGVSLLNNGIGLLLNGLGNINNSYDNTNVTKTENDDLKEEDQTKEEISKKVIDILGEDYFNGLPEDMKEDILKKYSTITTYAKNNNIEISDAEMARRLNNYITALKAHKQELEFGKHLINNGADAEFTGESIVYDDIATEKEKPPSEENDNAYYATLLNRGIGTVQLYDTNGDNQVSRKEFLEKEKADWKNLTGEDITPDMEKATTALFNRINMDNETEFLSNAELGAFEYARATTGDVSTNSNQELTYEEWYLSSSGIGVSDKITSDFERAQNQIYQILNERDKPI